MTFDDIKADFALLDDWEDRYRFVIELGRMVPELAAADRIENNKVRGCASQVWLTSALIHGDGAPRLHFTGDSDAHIVRGLVAILFSIIQDRSASDILTTDIQASFAALGLKDHLTPQRSNGLASMIERVRADARRVAAGGSL